MEAKERLYKTVDGQLVREGDPRGAFLAYAVGEQIGTNHEAAVNKLTSGASSSDQLYHDDEARALGRKAQAEPTAVNSALLAEKLEGDPTAPVFYHDRLATELADEARERANSDQALDDSGESSSVRLYWTSDAKEELVKEGHPDAAFLAYAPGDKIRRSDLDAFEAAQDDDQDEKVEEAPAPAKRAAAPATKNTTAPANK